MRVFGSVAFWLCHWLSSVSFSSTRVTAADGDGSCGLFADASLLSCSGRFSLNQLHGLIANLTASAVADASPVKKFELYHCKIRENFIDVVHLTSLMDGLEILEMRDCNLKALVFDFTITNDSSLLDSVKQLNVSGCQLKFIKVISESDHGPAPVLTGLTVVDLSRNRLISASVLKFLQLLLPHVEWLDLSDNDLSHFGFEEPAAFGSELQFVNLSRNYLQNPPSLPHYPKLRVLDLSRNRLYLNSGLDSDEVLKSVSLEELDVSFNQFSPLDQYVFPPMRKLASLKIKHVGITHFHLSSVKKLPALKYLDLSDNHALTGVYGFFGQLAPSIREIYLKYCGIHQLDFAMFENSRKVHWNLEGNPIHCQGCNLTWLSVAKDLKQISENLICADLPAANGQRNSSYLNDLQVSVYRFLTAWYNSSYCNSAAGLINLDTEALNVRYVHYGDDMRVPCQGFTGQQPFQLSWSRGLADPNPLFSWDSETQETVLAPDSVVNVTSNNKFHLLPGGTLVVKGMVRGDIDLYTCTLHSDAFPGGNMTALFSLRLSYSHWWYLEVFSVVVAIATGVLLAVVQGLWALAWQGISWRVSDMEKSSRARQMVEALERYKHRQMEALHEKYSQSAARISDNYHMQVEHLRQAYASQTDRFRDLRTAQMESVSAHLDTARENYASQMLRLREYGSRQSERVWDSYMRQRERVRMFTTQQRDRLMHQYHIKQQYIDKILKSLNFASAAQVEPIGPIFQPPPEDDIDSLFPSFSAKLHRKCHSAFDDISEQSLNSPGTSFNRADNLRDTGFNLPMDYPPALPLALPEDTFEFDFDDDLLSDYQSLPPDVDDLYFADFRNSQQSLNRPFTIPVAVDGEGQNGFEMTDLTTSQIEANDEIGAGDR